ncbi:hypothetical protein ACO22_00788 [Paracoccidioides brasiliensis]|uniref:Uncharacterized protein n=1 Tax=Paracoccidioides brasiliensis TaxID=121759 RepID=A0A1D2JNC5_PARBR|nr:hypothetical protein ACO22_00788 [Paracoccidioides brasiliensis]
MEHIQKLLRPQFSRNQIKDPITEPVSGQSTPLAYGLANKFDKLEVEEQFLSRGINIEFSIYYVLLLFGKFINATYAAYYKERDERPGFHEQPVDEMNFHVYNQGRAMSVPDIFGVEVVRRHSSTRQRAAIQA